MEKKTYSGNKSSMISFCKKRNLNICFLLLSFLFFSSNAWAQTKTVTGTVKDGANAGEPLIGVTVQVEGTNIGTVTDFDGNFSLSGVPENGTLSFSFIGYETKKEPVAGKTHIVVTLGEDTEVLDEVVVVGFGTQKVVNLTGSVGTASAKDIADRPVASAAQALQGVVPGLNIMNSGSGGELNASKSINIRGDGNLGGDFAKSDPLILIDGMEGDINLINPQDIESISVLKDAAASAIYGSRAPFGVILVTTKSGKEGRSVINYNNNFRFNTPLFTPDLMDSWEYVNYFNDVARYSKGSLPYNEEYVQNVYNYVNGLSDQYVHETAATETVDGGSAQRWINPYANVDWVDQYYKKWAMSQEHNLSASGGTEKITYYFSANYMTLGGFMNYGTDQLDRYTLTGKFSAQLTNYLKLEYSARWVRRDYERATQMNGGFYDNMMRRSSPLNPIYDPNGYYSEYSYIELLENGGRSSDQNDQLSQQVKVTITPLKNWNIIGEMNIRTNNDWTHEYSIPVARHAADDPDKMFYSGEYGNGQESSVKEYSYKDTYLNPNIYTNYNFSVGQNNFAITAGTQIEQLRKRQVEAYKKGLASEDFPVLNLALMQDGISTSGEYQMWRTAGFFGRINYDYAGRYLVELNARYDGTSRFRDGKDQDGKSTRWVLSPSASIGWNMAKENFWAPVAPYIQMFKLRASYGQLANHNTNSWYPTYRTLNIYANSGNWLVNGEKPTTSEFPSLITAYLTWEKVRTTNIGVDIAAFKNRLTASFDYFERRTLDMMGSGGEEKLPATLGASVPNTNNTDMKNTGWELSVAWRDQQGDFSYGARINISDNKTRLLRYPANSGRELDYENYNAKIEGELLGNIYGFETKGIANSQDEMDAHLASLPNGGQDAIGSNWEAGDIMYVDLNGDGKITRATTLDDVLEGRSDYKLLGNTNPRFRTGINLDLAWKGIDFSVFFQGVLKRDYYFSPNGGAGAGAKSAVFWGATSGNES